MNEPHGTPEEQATLRAAGFVWSYAGHWERDASYVLIENGRWGLSLPHSGVALYDTIEEAIEAAPEPIVIASEASEPDWQAMGLELHREAERAGVSLYHEGMRVWVHDCIIGTTCDAIIKASAHPAPHAYLGPDLSHVPTALLVAWQVLRPLCNTFELLRHGGDGAWLDIGWSMGDFEAGGAMLGMAVHRATMVRLRALPGKGGQR